MKKARGGALFIGMTVSLMLLSACGNHERVKISADSEGARQGENNNMGEELPAPLGFQDIYENILANSCVSCHKSYDTYSVVAQDADKILNQVLTNQMPKFGAPVSDDLKEILEDWVLSGAPEFPEN